jgi:leucyl-tRNA synthetase
MFASPPEQSLEWSDSGVEGAHRFLKRLWFFSYEQHVSIRQLNANESPAINVNQLDKKQREMLRQLYEIVEQINYDYERLQLNTVVSGCMKLLNLFIELSEEDHPDQLIQMGLSILLRLLAPIAPHISHQLWQDLHYPGILLNAAWPTIDTAALKIDHINLVVQINGKLRTHITVNIDADKETIENTATQDAKVQQSIADKIIKKIIIVPGRLINIVTE